MGTAPAARRPPRAGTSQRWWALALAAILVAVLLVIAGELFFPFRGPGHSSITPGHLVAPDPTNSTFLQDLGPARSLAANLTGGPWSLVGGLAITSVRATTLPLDASGAFSCPLIPEPYRSLSTVVFPRVFGVTGGGLAPVWTYDFLGATGRGVRIAVVDGLPGLLGGLQFDSPACPASERPTVNVSNAYDSSLIGLTALNLGGASFLATNPNAQVTFEISPGAEPGPHGGVAEEWRVTYDACGSPVPGTSLESTLGSKATYVFDAGTGVLQSSGTSAYTCPLGANAPIPYALPEDLTLNDPIVLVLGSSAVYNASVATACCGLTFANLTWDLRLPAGTAAPVGAWLTVLNASGSVVCTVPASALNGSASRCGAGVDSGDLLSLTLPAAGNGLGDLVLHGLWDFTGEVVVPLGNATAVTSG